MHNDSSTHIVYQIAQVLQDRGLVDADWAQETIDRAERVRLFRNYYDGNHRAKLTANMRKMLTISGDVLDQFNLNYCELVVDTLADRLQVDNLEAPDNDEGQAWADGLRNENRFDALQDDVHLATVRDGDSYVMVDYSESEGRTRWTHEQAYDGDEGVIVVYSDHDNSTIEAGIKIWREASFDESYHVNIYFGDEWLRYTYGPHQATNERGETVTEMRMTSLTDQPDEWRVGRVPFIHYKNAAGSRDRFGKSALKNIVPMVDGLNRVFTSMIMASLLTAFRMTYTKGFDLSGGIAPGSNIPMFPQFANKITELLPEERGEIAAALNAMEFGALEAGDMMPFIESANFIIEQISTIGRTPLPNLMGGSNESGEALKQRETQLLGKVRGLHSRLGNAWEDVLRLSVDVQDTYGGNATAPAVDVWNAVWMAAETRNHAEIREKAKLLNDMGFQRQALRELGYDDATIDQLMREQAMDAGLMSIDAGGDIPGIQQAAADLLAS
jgi:hypothetical protein